jgi:hypothetical protein
MRDRRAAPQHWPAGGSCIDCPPSRGVEVSCCQPLLHLTACGEIGQRKNRPCFSRIPANMRRGISEPLLRPKHCSGYIPNYNEDCIVPSWNHRLPTRFQTHSTCAMRPISIRIAPRFVFGVCAKLRYCCRTVAAYAVCREPGGDRSCGGPDLVGRLHGGIGDPGCRSPQRRHGDVCRLIADDNNARIRAVDHATGVITTIAGDGTQANTGDGGPAPPAEPVFGCSQRRDARPSPVSPEPVRLRR